VKISAFIVICNVAMLDFEGILFVYVASRLIYNCRMSSDRVFGLFIVNHQFLLLANLHFWPPFKIWRAYIVWVVNAGDRVRVACRSEVVISDSNIRTALGQRRSHKPGLLWGAFSQHLHCSDLFFNLLSSVLYTVLAFHKKRVIFAVEFDERECMSTRG
jgi:hypothetical protein